MYVLIQVFFDLIMHCLRDLRMLIKDEKNKNHIDATLQQSCSVDINAISRAVPIKHQPLVDHLPWCRGQ